MRVAHHVFADAEAYEGIVHPLHHRRISLLEQALFARKIYQVAGLGSLGLQIETIVLVGPHNMWNAPGNLDAIPGQIFNLLGVIGNQLDGLDFE